MLLDLFEQGWHDVATFDLQCFQSTLKAGLSNWVKDVRT